MKGLIHIYTGDGKGKTTSAIGLTIRALSNDMKVVFTQFMKGDNSSELKILKKLDNIEFVFCKENFGFVWNMDEEEKIRAKNAYTQQFLDCTNKAIEIKADMLVLDEFNSAYELGFINNEIALNFLKSKPENLEIVLTGRNPKEELTEIADYISEINKVKHPFDKGINARKGIEF